jgi:hypothetical protein
MRTMLYQCTYHISFSLTLNEPLGPLGGGGLCRIGRSSIVTRGGGGMTVVNMISMKLDALMIGPVYRIGQLIEHE